MHALGNSPKKLKCKKNTVQELDLQLLHTEHTFESVQQLEFRVASVCSSQQVMLFISYNLKKYILTFDNKTTGPTIQFLIAFSFKESAAVEMKATCMLCP